MVLDLGVYDEDDQGDDACRQRMPGREQHGGNAGQGAADHRQEVDKRHPQRPQERERHAEQQQRHEDDDPAISEVRKFPSMYPVTERLTSRATSE